ncbi:MAG: cupin domain-containing protein [Gaiella sp.]
MRDAPVPEARLDDTTHGRSPASEGWYVMNLVEARGEGNDAAGAWWLLEDDERPWPDFGANVHVLEPGQVACRYHQESAQEGFLVLHGECLLLVEEQERHLRQWDWFHCPGGTRHVFVGAGDGPCAILMSGARPSDNDIHYPVSELAARHGASVATPTDQPREAYADWPGPSVPRRPAWPVA